MEMIRKEDEKLTFCDISHSLGTSMTFFALQLF